MDKFLGRHKLATFIQEEIEIMNRPITSKEIELVIKKLPTKESPGPDTLTIQFYQKLKNNTYKFPDNRCGGNIFQLIL